MANDKKIKERRIGKRKARDIGSRANAPDLGYYIIITDAEETEINYITGIKNTIPKNLRRRLVIVPRKTNTQNLVEEAVNYASRHEQYGEIWIIFDRDKVPNFDKIVALAKKEGVHVGWSNPCIEVWFMLYFDKAPTYMSLTPSVECCKKFGELYKNKVGQKYNKGDKNIYEKLIKYGNESKAINRAKNKLDSYTRSDITKPSEMISATTIFQLVEEIRNKIKLSY